MGKEEMTRLCEILQRQDEELEKIFSERKFISEFAKKHGFYDELWEMLYKDGKSHSTF